MANLSVPSNSTLFKIFLAVLFLVIGGAAGTFSYLGFVELQQLNESITEDRDRLARLESAPILHPTSPPLPSNPSQPPNPSLRLSLLLQFSQLLLLNPLPPRLLCR